MTGAILLAVFLLLTVAAGGMVLISRALSHSIGWLAVGSLAAGGVLALLDAPMLAAMQSLLGIVAALGLLPLAATLDQRAARPSAKVSTEASSKRRRVGVLQILLVTAMLLLLTHSFLATVWRTNSSTERLTPGLVAAPSREVFSLQMVSISALMAIVGAASLIPAPRPESDS